MQPGSKPLARDARNGARARPGSQIDPLAPLVLIVDDDDAVARHAALQLRRAGYRATIAPSGAAAIAAIAQAVPDVIVLDHYLPDTTGEDLLRTLRAADDTALSPVIYLTVDGSRQRFRSSMTGGADDFLSKPFKPGELRDAVAAQLRKAYARMIARPDAATTATAGPDEQVARLADDMRALQSRLALAYEERQRTQIELAVVNATIDHRIEQKTRALERQNAALKAYGYALAHELRRPLRGILGFAGILRDSTEPDGDSAQLLARIEKSGRHMGDFIDGLLAMAAAERGPLARSRVDLGALAADILEAAALPPGAVANIAPGLAAQADPVLARVVLENLLSNAVKYSAHQARPLIEVDACEINGERCFFIRDNGTGFDMQDAERMFRPFERLHSTALYEGMGIGLATVQQVIDRHGGRVWARSAPGEGATVFFNFGLQEKRSGE